ncbi:flagellar hook-basal body complex protein FliE [Roseivivax sp. CAU 1761]
MTESLVSSNAALGAYRASQGLTFDRGSAAAAPQADGADFAQLLVDAGASAVREARSAERVMQEGLAGGHTTQEVVQATLSLESTVKTTVAIRDKLVEAYQEIMRMPM